MTDTPTGAGAGLIQVAVVFMLMAGCGIPPDDIDIPREECAKRCIDVRLGLLNDIDHEQLSAEAVREIVASCRQHYSCRPCKYGRGTGIVYDVDSGDITLCGDPVRETLRQQNEAGKEEGGGE